MSKLRMFPKAQHAVRLPALPRQVVFLVLLINIIGFGLTIPYIIGEWTNRTMRRALRAMRRMAMRLRRWKRRHRCRRRRDRQLLTPRACTPMLDPNRWRG